MVASQRGWQQCRAAFAVYKTIRRSRTCSTASATILSRLQQQLQQDQLDAAVVASLLASTAVEETTRRTEIRALGKWRGSTLAGYLRNDETSRREEMRLDLVLDFVGRDARVVHGTVGDGAPQPELPELGRETLLEGRHAALVTETGPFSPCIGVDFPHKCIEVYRSVS